MWRGSAREEEDTACPTQDPGLSLAKHQCSESLLQGGSGCRVLGHGGHLWNPKASLELVALSLEGSAAKIQGDQIG